jgi:hypothetical protein
MDESTSPEESFYVFIDTNLVRSTNGAFDIFKGQILKDLLIIRDFVHESFHGKKNIQLVIPDLVAKERYSQKAHYLSKEFDKFLRIYKEFNQSNFDDLVKIQKNLPKIVADKGKWWLNKHKISISDPFDTKYLEKIIEKALNYQPPFDKSDKGFKDAIIWYTIVDFVKKRIKTDNSHIIYLTSDKGFNFIELKKEFRDETGSEIEILIFSGDKRIRYYDPQFSTFLLQILRNIDNSTQLTDIEINYIKNVNEIILCSVMVNPLPINFALLISENLTYSKFKEEIGNQIINFLKNLKFNTSIIESNIIENPLSPYVTVYLRNYKDWFLDIFEIELEYECDTIIIENGPEIEYSIVEFYERPREFQLSESKNLALYLKEKGYGPIDPVSIEFHVTESVSDEY